MKKQLEKVKEGLIALEEDAKKIDTWYKAIDNSTNYLGEADKFVEYCRKIEPEKIRPLRREIIGLIEENTQYESLLEGMEREFAKGRKRMPNQKPYLPVVGVITEEIRKLREILKLRGSDK